jgi:hypothetical protein
VLAIQAPRQRYPDWVLLALRKGEWFAGTDPSVWRYAFDPAGDWAAADFDDTGWPVIGGTGVKGPPEEPFIWVQPEPYLDMAARAIGIRPGREWPPNGRAVVYRTAVEVP